MDKIIKQDDLCNMLGKGRVTIWRWVRDGVLPQPMKINGVILGWEKNVIDDWLKDLAMSDSK
ncbi:helix-turn-helix transcriptional regulator [Photobacterium leiognathi]|uniref:helix-turn-helix transcriptional regulator n=1 Tax=Photobacterium leiognathi TaxID=553611 RepID=UPI00298252F5|nr:AlpA family phage regulatory protein [Photobacterium leiognathi]